MLLLFIIIYFVICYYLFCYLLFELVFHSPCPTHLVSPKLDGDKLWSLILISVIYYRCCVDFHHLRRYFPGAKGERRYCPELRVCY